MAKPRQLMPKPFPLLSCGLASANSPRPRCEDQLQQHCRITSAERLQCHWRRRSDGLLQLNKALDPSVALTQRSTEVTLQPTLLRGPIHCDDGVYNRLHRGRETQSNADGQTEGCDAVCGLFLIVRGIDVVVLEVGLQTF